MSRRVSTTYGDLAFFMTNSFLKQDLRTLINSHLFCVDNLSDAEIRERLTRNGPPVGYESQHMIGYHWFAYPISSRFMINDCWCVYRRGVMRDAMFFPNRILYREELLSTTVTYAVDLSEAEFWNLKPIMPIEELGICFAEFRLNEVADKILERYAMHELDSLASVNANIARVQYLVENWDYREIGHIRIGGFRADDDGRYAITDGNHRYVAFALLLSTHSVTNVPRNHF